MSCFFFFNASSTTEIYTLSLHDALPICFHLGKRHQLFTHSEFPKNSDMSDTNFIANIPEGIFDTIKWAVRDRKSTRLNSSHGYISYAVFCLKKKIDQVHEIIRIVHYNTA